jgi:hypothetical protein
MGAMSVRAIVWMWITAVVIVAGCASQTHRASLPRSAIGTKYARQTGYFAACGTYCKEEETTARIQHDVIRDEATLVSAGPEETCVELVVRTESGVDEPFDQLGPAFTVDGKERRAVVDNEVISVIDYAYTGQVQTVQVEGVAAGSFVGMALSEQREMTFRVIERRGKLCAAGGASRTVSLSMRNPHLDVGMSKGRLDFDWQFER